MSNGRFVNSDLVEAVIEAAVSGPLSDAWAARLAVRYRNMDGWLRNDAALTASLTQISVRQNDDMRKISAWVAMAAVPTMVAGIYGMNFENMPELQWAFGYPLAIAVMIAADAYLYYHFKKLKWL